MPDTGVTEARPYHPRHGILRRTIRSLVWRDCLRAKPTPSGSDVIVALLMALSVPLVWYGWPQVDGANLLFSVAALCWLQSFQTILVIGGQVRREVNYEREMEIRDQQRKTKSSSFLGPALKPRQPTQIPHGPWIVSDPELPCPGVHRWLIRKVFCDEFLGGHSHVTGVDIFFVVMFTVSFASWGVAVALRTLDPVLAGGLGLFGMGVTHFSILVTWMVWSDVLMEVAWKKKQRNM